MFLFSDFAGCKVNNEDTRIEQPSMLLNNSIIHENTGRVLNRLTQFKMKGNPAGKIIKKIHREECFSN